MSLFSFHLAKTSVLNTLSNIIAPPKSIPGLVHSQCMAAMTLGSPILSSKRILALRSFIKTHNVTCVLVEPGAKQKAIDKIFNGGDYKAVDLDPLGRSIPLTETAYVDYIKSIAASLKGCHQ